MDKNELIDLYKKAIYVIEDQHQDIILKHTGDHTQSDLLLERYGVELAAFITPENPFSIALSAEENALRHERFLTNLRAVNLTFIKGYGTDESGEWGKEISYLVMVESKEVSDTLSGLFGQNAYLLLSKGYSPRLRCLNTIQYSNLD